MTALIESLVGQAALIISGLVVVIALIWSIGRSGSFFELRYRLWRLARPEGEVRDERVRQAIQDRADLSAFRTLLIRADTLGEAQRIADFAQSNGLDPGTLGDCGRYFHRRDLTISEKLPALLSTKRLVCGSGTLLAFVAFVAFAFACQPRMLASFNDDGTSFWLGQHEAHLFWHSNGQVLTQGDCPRANGGVAGFSSEHTKVLCGYFGSASLARTVRQGVQAQRWTSLVVTFALIVVYGYARR